MAFSDVSKSACRKEIELINSEIKDLQTSLQPLVDKKDMLVSQIQSIKQRIQDLQNNKDLIQSDIA